MQKLSDTVQLLPNLVVSRETYDKLCGLDLELVKWTKKINLVSKNTIDDSWQRHIIDSAQLVLQIPQGAKKLVDIGSGGGLPGLVIAIICQETHPDMSITLIEIDKRKVVFLKEMNRKFSLGLNICNQRIEDAVKQNADVLTARALSSLNNLMEYAFRHTNDNAVCIFPKGKQSDEEIINAQKYWSFSLQNIPSITHQEGSILLVKGASRVE